MPPRRIGSPITAPVTLRVDGEDVLARPGEPIAAALIAEGRLLFGRSVKYHRPRGPACLAGSCDGCLMRVDGVPSVMTCRTPARHGQSVETQNVWGSARFDLLAATDWVFPDGMDHHRMFTWSRVANEAMQHVARRIAGVGTLPAEPRRAVAPATMRCDVVVVGGGPSGLAAAQAAAHAGLEVVVLDEDEGGGAMARARDVARPNPQEAPAAAATVPLLAEALAAGAMMLPHTHALGVFDERSDDGTYVVLAGDAHRAITIHARRLLVASGRREGACDFEGNDLPGIFTSEGALRLLRAGVLCGERVVVAAGASPDAARAGSFVATALRDAGAEVHGPVPLDLLQRAGGSSAIAACTLLVDEREVDVPCDALVVASPTSAAHELAAQAGIEVRFRGEGFDLVAAPLDGATRVPWARAVGSATGVFELDAALAQARAAGRAFAEELAP